MEDCIFCKIISGDLPSANVYEDENTYAFLDAKPINMGHTLVVPKKHYRNIFDTPEETVCQVMKTVKKLAPAIKTAMDADGINIHNNNESAAWQEIFHYHVHIIPRDEGDGYAPWRGDRGYREGEKDEIVSEIQQKIDEKK